MLEERDQKSLMNREKLQWVIRRNACAWQPDEPTQTRTLLRSPATGLPVHSNRSLLSPRRDCSPSAEDPVLESKPFGEQVPFPCPDRGSETSHGCVPNQISVGSEFHEACSSEPFGLGKLQPQIGQLARWAVTPAMA